MEGGDTRTRLGHIEFFEVGNEGESILLPQNGLEMIWKQFFIDFGEKNLKNFSKKKFFSKIFIGSPLSKIFFEIFFSKISTIFFAKIVRKLFLDHFYIILSQNSDSPSSQTSKNSICPKRVLVSPPSIPMLKIIQNMIIYALYLTNSHC